MADTLTDSSFLKIDTSRVWIGGGDIRNLLQGTLGGRTILHFLRRSDVCYQALSTQSKVYLASWGFRSERIIYIPGSVDTEKFRPAPRPADQDVAQERTLICVARLDHSKGIDVLLHAWKRMLSSSCEWRMPYEPKLRLVGDGDLRPQLERMAVELDIGGSLEFLGSRSDIVDLLQQAWGFVLPSRNEGMPNALLEAMACGLPCVATRVSGSEDVITDGQNGLLVEPEEPAHLARALRSLIEDSGLAQRLGQEGRATVVREYQLVHIVGRCLELYRQLLSEKSGKRAKTC
jgi:glycosyltransferase involved in cell wall biosynthesis